MRWTMLRALYAEKLKPGLHFAREGNSAKFQSIDHLRYRYNQKSRYALLLASDVAYLSVRRD